MYQISSCSRFHLIGTQNTRNFCSSYPNVPIIQWLKTVQVNPFPKPFVYHASMSHEILHFFVLKIMNKLTDKNTPAAQELFQPLFLAIVLWVHVEEPAVILNLSC